MKKLLLSILFIYIYCNLFAQNSISLAMSFEGKYNAKNITVVFNDGLIDSSFQEIPTKNFILNSKLLAPFGTFEIKYNNNDHRSIFSKSYIVSGTSSHALFKIDTSNNRISLMSSSVDIIDLYDTSSNVKFAQILRYLQLQPETRSLDDFMQSNGNFPYKDSIQNTHFQQLFKNHTYKQLEIIKENANDYYYYYYFKTQVLAPALNILKHDRAYMLHLFNFFDDVFPKKFRNTVYGRSDKTFLDAAIGSSITVNMPTPSFSAKDINGRTVSSNNLKGKFILLDFWATWCGPCLAKMPLMKKIRDSFPANKLVIIGVSGDLSYKALNDYIHNNGVKWPQVYDKYRHLSNLFKIESIPTLFLIDKTGKIAYVDNNESDDMLFNSIKYYIDK